MDGSKAIFLVNRSTFNDKNGDILGLVTVLQDITESNRSQKVLEENEERYKIVTEQTGQLVYDNNIKSNKLFWAGAVEEVFGYNLEEGAKSLSLKTGLSISNRVLGVVKDITEQKLTIAAPRRWKEKYRIITDRTRGNLSMIINLKTDEGNSGGAVEENQLVSFSGVPGYFPLKYRATS